MMRLMIKILIIGLLLCGLMVAALLGLSQTRYAMVAINHVLAEWSEYQFVDTTLDYELHDPLQLTLHTPTLINTQRTLLSANSLTVRLSPRTFTHQQPIFSYVIVDGITLKTSPTSFFHYLKGVRIDRLALNDITVTTPEISLSQAQIQIDHWQYQDAALPWWQQFEGGFQFNVPQLTWQGLALSQILFDGEQQGGDWHIKGFSGQWQQAHFNGQADFSTATQQLTFHQLTLTDWHIQPSLPLPQWEAWITDMTPIRQINVQRADMLTSSIEQPTWSVDNVNLSLTDWSWPMNYWQQENARLSFGAEYAQWQMTSIEAPLAELRFTPQQIVIEGMSAQVFSGHMRMAGTWAPNEVHVDQFMSSGMNVFLPEDWRDRATQLTQAMTTISIDALDINHLQLTSTDPVLPFQLAGIDIEGKDTVIKQSAQWGLWQGDVQASLGFASINHIVFTDPILRMYSQDGHWQIPELVLPFTDGMLTAEADVDLGQSGKPWQFSVNNTSVPASIISRWLHIPLPLQGRIDGTVQAQGLASDKQRFNYSLSGQTSLSFRNMALKGLSPATLLTQWQHQQPFIGALLPPLDPDDGSALLTAQPLHISAERGVITVPYWQMKNDYLSLSLSGRWDLVSPDQQHLEWVLSEGCQQLHRRWHNSYSVVNSLSRCNGNIK